MLDWQFIAGAMFGDLGFTIPLAGPLSAITPFFGEGGNMIHKGEPVNTTVSATLLVRRGMFAGRKMMLEANQAEVALGRRLFAEECGELVQRLRSEERPSVLVVENPNAANPLSRHWFCGPFDERFGLDDRGFGCIFCRLRPCGIGTARKKMNTARPDCRARQHDPSFRSHVRSRQRD